MAITNEERAYLLEKMKALLEEYDYKYEEIALNIIITKWYSQKEPLIEAFKKHPNYIESKFMIAFEQSYERCIDTDESYSFSKYLTDWIFDNRLELPQDIIDAREKEGCSMLPHRLWLFIGNLYAYARREVPDEVANLINEYIPSMHIHEGQKMSRVINKLCIYLGVNKDKDYNRMFAKYADSLSPLKVKRHTILSLNPLDYLTMSFGNSWASCHTIDKNNKRGMPNSYEGMYSSGTMSYMLDPSSIVFYTVDEAYNGTEYFLQPKICRQMYHWGNDKLVQGRLYPQDNDGCGTIYSEYRAIVQDIIATVFDIPNLWTIRKGTDAASEYIYSHGTHYRDYENFDNCTLSILKGSDNHEYINVGAYPICIKCGDEHGEQGNICCCGGRICDKCGCVIEDEEDGVWLGDNFYCTDCCSWCSFCEEYHRRGETYIEGYGWVCDDCLDDHFTYCEECNTWVHNDCSTYIEETDEYICDTCRDRLYFWCHDCHEYRLIEEANEIGDCTICNDCKEKRDETE